MDWFDPEYVAQRAAEREAKVAKDEQAAKRVQQVVNVVVGFFKKAVAA